MKQTLAYVVVGMASLVVMAVQAQSVTVVPKGAPVVAGRAPLAKPSQRGMDEAQAALRGGCWDEAVEIYKPLVNSQDAAVRGQARYGLAVALAQLGQEDQALQALEGTLADESVLGRAVAELRGNLLLQMADKALAEQGSGAAARWLGQYDRLTVQPDRARYDRVKSAGEVVASGGEPSMVLRVGVLLPMQGNLKPVGDDVLRSLQLGLRDFDGVRGTRIEVIPMAADDASTAEASARALVEQHVDVVVGPLMAGAVEAVKEIFRTAGVPVLSLSSDRAVVGGGVHALNYLPGEQARAVARAAVQSGRTKLAGLVPSTPYGYEVFDAFQDEAKRLGVEVVASAFYNPQNTDIGANIRTLAGPVGVSPSVPLKFDALFVPAVASTLPLVTAQLSYYDVDKVQLDGRKTLLMGTAIWQDNSLLSPSVSGVRGGVFAVPVKATAFEEAFQNTYGTAPLPLAVLGYDAARVLASVAGEKQRTSRGVADLLLRPEGFYGSGGYLRFSANGQTERGLNMVKIGTQFEVQQEALKLPPLPLPTDLQPSTERMRGRWW